MSVLIKGMEIPRNCWECEFNKSTLDRMDFCTLTNKQYNWGLSERPSDCPLVEVPTPHGRLIDGKALREKLLWVDGEYNSEHGKLMYFMDDIYSAIGKTPTIIEAEVEE